MQPTQWTRANLNRPWPPPMVGPTERAGSAPQRAAEAPAARGGSAAAREKGRCCCTLSPSIFQKWVSPDRTESSATNLSFLSNISANFFSSRGGGKDDFWNLSRSFPLNLYFCVLHLVWDEYDLAWSIILNQDTSKESDSIFHPCNSSGTSFSKSHENPLGQSRLLKKKGEISLEKQFLESLGYVWTFQVSVFII